MGRRRLITGMVVGATVGTVVALLDRETRDYAKSQLEVAKTNGSYLVKHPSEAIEKFRNTVDEWNHAISSGADNAINALEQVEDTINKFTNN